MSDTLTSLLLIVLCINVTLWLGQVAILKTNDQAMTFINCQGSILGVSEATGCTTTGQYILNDSNPTAHLPSGETSVSPETGNIFTDAFTGLKNFLLNTLGLGYVVQILSAPYNFLKALSLPQEFVFAVGSLWYLFSVFVLGAWLLGRD